MSGGVAMGALKRDRHVIAELRRERPASRASSPSPGCTSTSPGRSTSGRATGGLPYNHRNNFDPYVAIKLVRPRLGVGGEEGDRRSPRAPHEWLTPNVAFIDRSTRRRRSKAWGPSPSCSRDGVSVLVAPEGTRSKTGELGPFKKGPFRMAMTPGSRSCRSSSATPTRWRPGRRLIRPGTVDVDVLPPVPVDRLDRPRTSTRRSKACGSSTSTRWMRGRRTRRRDRRG